MDVVDLIKNDHKKVIDLLERLSSTTEKDAGEREESFALLQQLLKAHTSSEEEVVYMKAQAKSELKSLIRRSFEEHQTVDELLAELQDVDASTPEWLNQFKLLKQAVEQHRNSEELQVLPLVKQTFSFDAREEMGERMKSMEDEFMKHDVSKTQGFKDKRFEANP